MGIRNSIDKASPIHASQQAKAPAKAWSFPRIKRPSVTAQVFLALISGVLLGILAPEFAVKLKPFSDLFIHMIKMLIAPLLFSTLVLGIAGTGHGNLGRLGLKTLVYFEAATIPAVVIGLFAAHILKPGAGMPAGFLASAGGSASELAKIAGNAQAVAGQTFLEHIVDMVPTSVVDAMAKGNILQLVVFSVFFAVALSSIGEKAQPIVNVLESVSETMFKFVNIVMVFAPLGVLGAVSASVGRNGLVVLASYFKLVSSLYLALIVFVCTVLFTACSIARIPFLRLVKALKQPLLLAFSTASSESAFPQTMKILERFGVPKAIVSFVLPTGYSFNLDGSTLYLSLAAIFIAQLAHIELSWEQQLLMILTLLFTSKGVAAVPRASLVILAGTLTAFGLPLEGIAVILGIDHIMDMGRTSVNLMGNCVASVVVARWEGVFDDEKMRSFDFDYANKEPASDLKLG